MTSTPTLVISPSSIVTEVSVTVFPGSTSSVGVVWVELGASGCVDAQAERAKLRIKRKNRGCLNIRRG